MLAFFLFLAFTLYTLHLTHSYETDSLETICNAYTILNRYLFCFVPYIV